MSCKQRYLLICSLIIAAGILFQVATASATTGRKALVIGIAKYGTEDLNEVASDASSMASALSAVGFAVEGGGARLNLNKEEFRAAIEHFTSSLGAQDTALFYYSGHGIEALDENFLLSVDGDPAAAVESDILDRIGEITSGPKIVILDTCRAPASQSDGLKRPGALPLNSVLAYGSPPKRSISYPSKYTKQLLNRLREPGLEIADLFRSTKEKLARTLSSDGLVEQRAVEYGGLTEKFYFRSAVVMDIQIHSADDDLKVLISDDEVASWRTNTTKKKRVLLKPGENSLELRVHNWKTYTGGIPGWGGHEPEGWHFDVSFYDENGKLLRRFSDREDRPANGGPRHGQEFLAAHGIVKVDAATAQVTLNASLERR